MRLCISGLIVWSILVFQLPERPAEPAKSPWVNPWAPIWNYSNASCRQPVHRSEELVFRIQGWTLEDGPPVPAPQQNPYQPICED